MADDKKQLEAITPMEEDFAQWYTDVVKKAELTDYTSVKGCIVFKSAGYAIWENIVDVLHICVGEHHLCKRIFGENAHIRDLFLGQLEEVVDGMARREDYGRMVENVHLLVAELLSSDALNFDERAENKFHLRLLCDVIVR